MFRREFVFGSETKNRLSINVSPSFPYSPEKGYGFTTPQTFRADVPGPGEYKIAISLRTREALEDVCIFTGSGDLAFRGNIPAGIYRHSMSVNVGDRVFPGGSLICRDRALTVTVAAQAPCLWGLSLREASCPTVYLAGASPEDLGNTFSGPGNHGESGGETKDGRSGWQRMFSAYACDKIAVSNHSRPGLTPDSFRLEGHYSAIEQYSRPGDFYLFQFDWGKQGPVIPKTAENYRRELTRYILCCREKLIYPLLLTPLPRPDGMKEDEENRKALTAYADICRDVGTVTGVPVVRLHHLTRTPPDAYLTAGLVAGEIIRACEKFPGYGYRFLAKNLKGA